LVKAGISKEAVIFKVPPSQDFAFDPQGQPYQPQDVRPANEYQKVSLVR
jgi:hypothetical protein